MPSRTNRKPYIHRIGEGPDEVYISNREIKFCYLYAAYNNGTKAAKEVGYSEKSAGRQATLLLTYPAIQQRINDIAKEAMKEIMVTPFFVFKKALAVLDAAMEGEPVTSWNYETQKHEPTGYYRKDLRSATQILDMFGKYLNLFKNDDMATQINIITSIPARDVLPDNCVIDVKAIEAIPIAEGQDRPDTGKMEKMKAEAT